MKKTSSIVPINRIEHIIYIIREQKVMLDRDLAELYGVETKKLIQAVKRNIERFPEDFMFQLSKEELSNWKSQIVTSNLNSSRSQIVTLKRGHNIKYLPYAFTEQGVAMLSSVLRSSQATTVNIEIIRAFVHMRQLLSSHKTIIKDVDELKSFILKHSRDTSQEFRRIWMAIEKMSSPPAKNNPIGFRLD